jgi:TonB family protein
MRSLLVFSALGHFFLMLALMLTPGAPPLRIPPALTVDLVAALPPSPTPSAPVPAAPPKPKVKLLPKQAPPALPKAKPKAKPKPEPAIQRRARPKELAYEDALAKLRGEVDAEPLLAAAPPVPAASPGRAARGLAVAPELLAWHQAVKRHVRSVWITPPEFRDRGLAAELVIDVAADGRVLGRPELVASSGNPFYDDNAVRALLRASPLPAPPKAGRRTIVFTPEE